MPISDYKFSHFKYDTNFISYILRENQLYDDAYILENCASLLFFKIVETLDYKMSFRLKRANFCRKRICPMCTWRRAQKWRARLINVLPILNELYPDHRFLLLTLTVKNCHITELKQHIKILNKGWNAINKKRDKREKLSFIQGYIKAIEVSRPKNNLDFAHPHIHALLMVDESYFANAYQYLSNKEWQKIWQKAAKLDYEPIVDIRAIEKHEHESVIPEIASYVTKPEDFIKDENYYFNPLTAKFGHYYHLTKEPKDQIQDSGKWLIEYADQMYKRRAISSGGVLQEFFRDIEKNLHTDNEDLIGKSNDNLKIIGEFSSNYYEKAWINSTSDFYDPGYQYSVGRYDHSFRKLNNYLGLKTSKDFYLFEEMVHDFIEIKLNSYSKKQLSLEDPKELVISIEQEKLDDNYRDWSYENRIIEAKENQKIKHLVNALELENLKKALLNYIYKYFIKVKNQKFIISKKKLKITCI